MNPTLVLGLIIDLYGQLNAAQQENQQLREQLVETAPASEKQQ